MAGTATKVIICNMAIHLLGAKRISALTDGTEEAQILTDVYDYILDEVLAAHPWNFAIKRDTLAELATEPEYEFENMFQLPNDCLRVIRMEDDDAVFSIESDALLTDEGEAKIKYIARITDTSKYSPHFVTTLAARLASEIAFPLTNSTSLAEAMFKMYQEKVKTASSCDGQEGTADKVDETSWIDDRE